MHEPFHKTSCTVHVVAHLNTSPVHSHRGCVLRDRSLFREAKECERLNCANLVPLSPPCIHVADSPYLATVKHRGATMPCGPLSVHSARQTDRRPFAHRASTTLIREDKLGQVCESCSIDTIHLKILDDHILQMDFVCQQSPWCAVIVIYCCIETSSDIQER